MKVEQIAEICHEANLIYCLQLGDYSQPNWDDAEDWQKQSAISGVLFQKANPNSPPSASHESWLKEKEETGWKYGTVKDPVKKEHPCFVPYEQLPVEQQIKDHLFTGIARALIPFLKEE